MPIFEYACHDCGQQFETLVRSTTVAACPSCHSTDLEKLLSVFATQGSPADAAPMSAASFASISTSGGASRSAAGRNACSEVRPPVSRGSGTTLRQRRQAGTGEAPAHGAVRLTISRCAAAGVPGALSDTTRQAARVMSRKRGMIARVRGVGSASRAR